MNIITHNISALNAQRQFGINTNNKAKTAEKLSSGYRINRASDDAAGLSISEKMRRQIRGLSQGTENSEAGVSLCQVADGALAEVHDMLHRITELSVKSANGTNSLSDRQAIQAEINEILDEIDRIEETTSFNGHKIFKQENDGSTEIKTEFETVEETTVVTNSNMMSEAQAIQELKSGNFSIGQSDIVINGKTLTSENLTKYLTSMSTQYLWSEFKTLQSDLSKRDEVTEIFRKIYDNLCITTENDIINDRDGGQNDGKLTEILNHTETYLNEAINATDTTTIEDLAGRYANEFRSPSFYSYPINTYELIKAAERYYIGKGGEDQADPNSNNGSYFYVADEVGCWSMQYAGNYIKEDIGSDYYQLPSILQPLTDDRFIASSYIAWSNIEAGYDENGKKEITTTIQRPITSTFSQPIDAKWNLWIQSGSDTMDGIPLEIDRMNTKILGINDLNVTSIEGAEHAMTAVEGALEKLSANRSKIGAQQNRLEHTIRNQENTVENTTASESRIRDADMADLMVEYSKDSILEQAGHAMMAQANQSTSGILNLLQ